MDATRETRIDLVPLTVRTVVVHTLTYFIAGALAYKLGNYEKTFSEPPLSYFMRPTSDPWIMAGPLLQPVRGVIFALAFYPLRGVLFARPRGWLTLWWLLVALGILSTFGPSPGSVEGMIYTIVPPVTQILGLWEVVLQSLLFAAILVYWVRHVEKRWLNWTLGFAFSVVMLLSVLGLFATHVAPASAQAVAQPGSRAERPPPKPQTRPLGRRIDVNRSLIEVDDGDTVKIRWSAKDEESVRILGIDTPETRHPEHDLPYAQPLGAEARAFGQGAFAAATRIELLRSATLDPFGRTLGYFFLNGQNYSVLVVRARLAEESISRYGDNGLPQEAAEVTAAAKAAGPMPFEPPGVFRGRMRELTKWLRERGVDPKDVN